MSKLYNPGTTRRDALRVIAGTIACFGAMRLAPLSAAEDLPHLTDSNPAAASLAYTEDADTVDVRKFPSHKPGQRCANCKYFQAAAGSQYAPCRLYPGTVVNAKGWCAGYTAA